MRDAVDVLAPLRAAPERFNFFAALRRVDCAYPDRPRLGQSQRAADDAIRIGQRPSLAFEPAMLAGFDAAGARPRLEVNFLGLLGANGPMPAHLTEYIRDRQRNAGDPTLARFLDIFHHRMLSLFYRAWASAQPTVSLDRPAADRFGSYVATTIGLGSPALRGRDSIPDLAKLHFSGRLADRRRNAEGLVAILAEYFGVPVALRQFVGHWLALPADQRSRLGRHAQGSRLGVDTIAGRAVWNVQHKFRIVVGPLDLGRFRALLPGEAGWRRLRDWVRQYVGDELDWELQLVLRRREVPRLRLGSGVRLGHTSWLASRTPARDADQLVLQPSSGSAAA